MSLFLAIPIPPEIGQPILEQLQSDFSDVTIEWFNPHSLHLTTAYLSTRFMKQTEAQLIEKFRREGWMQQLVRPLPASFKLRLDQLRWFGHHEILVLAGRRGMKCRELRQLADRSRFVLSQVGGSDIGSTWGFEPHVSLGRPMVLPLPDPGEGVFTVTPTKLEMRVDTVALYQRCEGEPEHEYHIVEDCTLGTLIKRAP